MQTYGSDEPENAGGGQQLIAGKSVRIRTIEEKDLPSIKAINEDPVVRANVVGWGWPNSLDELRRWHAHSQGGSTHRWIVEDREARVLGVTGLWDIDMQSRRALTALKLGGPNALRGRGVGTDAIMAVMAFAFYDLGLNRLYTDILTNNSASLGAYVEKCGWSHEGVAREHIWRAGGFLDVYHVGILRREFDALPNASEYVALACAPDNHPQGINLHRSSDRASTPGIHS